MLKKFTFTDDLNVPYIKTSDLTYSECLGNQSHMSCATQASNSIKGRSVGLNAKLINYINDVKASHK